MPDVVARRPSRPRRAPMSRVRKRDALLDGFENPMLSELPAAEAQCNAAPAGSQDATWCRPTPDIGGRSGNSSGGRHRAGGAGRSRPCRPPSQSRIGGTGGAPQAPTSTSPRRRPSASAARMAIGRSCCSTRSRCRRRIHDELRHGHDRWPTQAGNCSQRAWIRSTRVGAPRTALSSASVTALEPPAAAAPAGLVLMRKPVARGWPSLARLLVLRFGFEA
jgi:hypothetical protein